MSCAGRDRGNGAVGIDVEIGDGPVCGGFGRVHGAQLAPHLPAHPQQQQPAGEQQADDLEQLRGDGGEADAHRRGGADPDQDRLGALVFRQAGGGKADDDGIVAGQHQIDEDDFDER